MRFRNLRIARYALIALHVAALLTATAYATIARQATGHSVGDRPAASVETIVRPAPSSILTVPASVTSLSVAWGSAGSYSVTGSARTDLPWLGINKFSITLSSAASLGPADVTVSGISVANYGPVTISGSGTSFTITLAQPINSPDIVTLTVGNASITTFTKVVKVLPGDVSGDGAVNAADLVLVRNALTTPYNVFADINGDGAVNINDYNLVRTRVGTYLPSIP